MSIYDKASLVLIPSGTKTSKVFSQKPVNGDGDFTFSRSTAATRVNADGNIEKETQNLFNYSNNFGASYWLNNAGSCTRTGGQAGYDGTNDAWLLTQDGSGFDNILSNSTPVSGVYTFSVYAKANSGNTQFTMRAYSTTSRSEFNLTTGTIAASSGVIDDNIEDVGGGWYRCSVTFNASSDQFQIYPQWNSSSPASVYIQDAQLEQGLVARDYIETTTAAVEGGITDNVPRLDYTDSSCPALLLEPQRTNLIDQSEYFSDNSNWFKYNLGAGSLPIVTDNYGESPEGLQNAARLQLDAGGISSSDRSRLYTTIATTNGTNYTWSFYAKSNTGNNEYIKPRAADVNYSEITITTEWQRFDVSFTANATGTFQYGFECRGNHTENSVDILIYGAQIEAGSYATSYIPTYGTSVTRNVDSCLATSVSDVIGQTEGTLFMDADFIAGSGEDQTILIGVSGYNDYVFIQMTSGNRVEGGIIVNSTEHCRIGEVKPSGRYKCAFAYANNDFVFYINGEQIGVETSGSMSGFAVDFINLNFNNKGYSLNNHSLFKTRLSNEELAALTTI